jgi:hypothetical protein
VKLLKLHPAERFCEDVAQLVFSTNELHCDQALACTLLDQVIFHFNVPALIGENMIFYQRNH